MSDDALIPLLGPSLDLSGGRHGFFGRAGGVSQGLYASLNCGFGSADAPDNVIANRGRCAAFLGVAADALLTVHQVHGADVAEVTEPWRREAAPRADAIVTSRPGTAIGILTADCAPVLMADAERGIIGAAHAGWKGAKAGVAKSLVAAMVRLGAAPARIVACVGPTIGAGSYEVGHAFRAAFMADDPASARFFHDRADGNPHFDLQGFVAAQLESLGMAAVDRIAGDTCAEASRFFSYRRAVRRGEQDYGRQLSAIALPA
jgi:YfiH family protein